MQTNNTPKLGTDNLYHYTYMIVNDINGKYYKGVHTTSDIDDGYMGSGVLLKEDIEKIGINHFHKIFHNFYKTADESYVGEFEYITEEDLASEQCYNKTRGGCGSVYGTKKTNIKYKPLENKQTNLIEKKVLNRHEYEDLRKSVLNGDAIRIKNGIYVYPENAYETYYEIETIVPGGIMCMWSAWYYYDLCDTVPLATCVAIDAHRKVKVPSMPKFDLYYWNTNSLNTGVTSAVKYGIEFRIFDRERCVCDAVRFRNKIGFDVVSEIINRYLSFDKKDLNKLYEYSKMFKIEKILKNIMYFKL